MEPERVVLGGRDQFDRSDDDLDQGIDQRFQGIWWVELAKHASPQLERVYKLPVVHELTSVLLFHRDGVPQVNGQLPDVHERVLVRHLLIHGKDFY